MKNCLNLRTTQWRRRAIMLWCALSCTPVHAKAIKIGKAELLYTEDEIPIRYDGSLSTIRRDGTMYFFHSFGCRLEPASKRRSRHSWHHGTPLDPLKIHLFSKTDDNFWDYNGYYQNMKEEGIWILGMYKRENGDLLGITHSEVQAFPGGKRNQVFSIGLGYSTDDGASWTYCGEIVRAGNPHTNVGGGAYVIAGDYLYVYYNDRERSAREKKLCVARARLSEVLRDASQHRVGKWFKYRDGKWDTPGLSDRAGANVIPKVYGNEDLHADAAYCTALGKYLLTVQTHAANKLLLFSSADGVNWVQEAIVDTADKGEMQPYSSFVDFDGPADDCREVDGHFYVYYPRKRLDNHEIDTMYRRLITIE